MNARAQEVDLGSLSRDEIALSEETRESFERLHRQLTAELKAADSAADFAQRQMLVFFPSVTPETLQWVDRYAQALARQILARRALEATGWRP